MFMYQFHQRAWSLCDIFVNGAHKRKIEHTTLTKIIDGINVSRFRDGSFGRTAAKNQPDEFNHYCFLVFKAIKFPIKGKN